MSITAEKLFEEYLKTKAGMTEEFPFTERGSFMASIPFESCARTVGTIELEDGRQAAVIIKVSCDEDDL